MLLSTNLCHPRPAGAKKSVVEQALRDFHLAGVDLPEQQKVRFKEIMQALAAAQAEFEHNVQDASDAWSLHIEDDSELAGLPRAERWNEQQPKPESATARACC